jgi:predicted nucleic acid-binding protein
VALVVLDASVVIAHLNREDALHERATEALRHHADDDLRLPASAYAEVLVDPARRGRLDDVRNVMGTLRLKVEHIDARVAERAAELRARHEAIHLPDALVLACGDVLEADAVLSADHNWRRFPRVRIVG